MEYRRHAEHPEDFTVQASEVRAYRIPRSCLPSPAAFGSEPLPFPRGRFCEMGAPFVSVRITRALLFEIFIQPLGFWKLPCCN